MAGIKLSMVAHLQQQQPAQRPSPAPRVLRSIVRDLLMLKPTWVFIGLSEARRLGHLPERMDTIHETYIDCQARVTAAAMNFNLENEDTLSTANKLQLSTPRQSVVVEEALNSEDLQEHSADPPYKNESLKIAFKETETFLATI
ncbi:hypothetical protein E4U12_000300 [Claviceps purpurea]|nr:hypothetical protein E4U12_000300 [Claviceps purpurea]